MFLIAGVVPAVLVWGLTPRLVNGLGRAVSSSFDTRIGQAVLLELVGIIAVADLSHVLARLTSGNWYGPTEGFWYLIDLVIWLWGWGMVGVAFFDVRQMILRGVEYVAWKAIVVGLGSLTGVFVAYSLVSGVLLAVLSEVF